MSPSRRDTIRFLIAGGATLGGGAAAMSLLTPQSDQQFLQALVDKGGGTVPARETPYRVTMPIRMPAGCTLRFATGAAILWDGPLPAGSRSPRGIFVPAGNGVTIGGRGTGVTIRASRPDPDLYGVLVAGYATVTVEEVSTIDCGHVFATTAVGDGARGCRDIVVRGGGASFAAVPANPWHAACTIQYADGFVVDGARYRNVTHGVQWWGGDAAPAADGAWERERRCRNGRVQRIEVDHAVGCSVWGSMGKGIRVVDCHGIDAGDVGFDAEGSIDVEFVRCSQTNAKRGCFSTFFFNRNITFRDCTGVQPLAAQPIFRIYSEVPGGNQDVSIIGGRFRCLDREPSTIDDAYGDARTVTVRGAILDNVTIVLHHREHSQIFIEDNSLTFGGPGAAVFDAIRIGVPVASPGTEPMLRISNNQIANHRAAGASIGVRVLRSADQPTDAVTVEANRVTGFARPLDAP